ncbi:MAG: negative regulator of beta-lactamase [Phycisphaeraceae bacterium]|nr:negative regulator of beta-lactamase [Phycisphaeraceae bacterium]
MDMIQPMRLGVRRISHLVYLGWLCLMTCVACAPRAGELAYQRQGDEIVAAGHLFHTNAPVVLWTDPGGYDAYRVQKRFADFDESQWQENSGIDTPNRYGQRNKANWPPQILEQIRGGGWDLALLQKTVDQFVIHYDVCGTSRQCFNILHDHRGLSVHFMLDLDGTIYQTLDLKERAWHAGVANDRSIGIEIANIGAYASANAKPLKQWYTTDKHGQTHIAIPKHYGDGGLRTTDFVGRPARNQPISGKINGRDLVQYDLTPQQYDSLIKLTAALCRIFPQLKCDVPRDTTGKMIMDRTLTQEELAQYKGLLGHHHIKAIKSDPGPAFNWDMLIEKASERSRKRRLIQ